VFADRDVLIMGGVRTPFCRPGTLLAGLPVRELGRIALREAIERADVASPEVDEVIVGHACGGLDGGDGARTLALDAGVPRSVPASLVGAGGCSGLRAIADAAVRIQSGLADVVVACGVESVSRLPVLFPDSFRLAADRADRARSRWARLAAFASVRPRDLYPVRARDACLGDGSSGRPLGETAETLVREFSLTRAQQDAYALESHRRAARAWREGTLAGEMVPVPLPPEYAELADRDNAVREEVSLESLASLPPRFEPEYGTVTAGNSCSLADGAAAVVLASGARARELGLEPVGRVRSVAFAGCDPSRMGLGAVPAIARVLGRSGASMAQIDLVEMHEAFAAQALACRRALASREFCRAELGLDAPVGEPDPERTNVHGGAIALGHPPAASGVRMVLTLLAEMGRRGAALGLAAVSAAGGQGGALIVERA